MYGLRLRDSMRVCKSPVSNEGGKPADGKDGRRKVWTSQEMGETEVVKISSVFGKFK